MDNIQIRQVLLVIYNPRIKGDGNRKLTKVADWNDPDLLTCQYIQDLRGVSHGYANFEVVKRVEVDRFPVKADGFVYNDDEYIRCIRSRGGFHRPDGVDYHRIIADFSIIDKVNSGAVDEVWLFGFPYAGFYESVMAGPEAFWCNAPELAGTESASRRFIIMGFNYERGMGEMLENMGHRAESVMERVYRGYPDETNLWRRFTRYDRTHPGEAEVGSIHFAPNSIRDYDWGNRRKVLGRHHTWKNFPDLDGEPQVVDSSHWGGGDIRAHHLWWFSLLPHVEGSDGDILSNWWKYVIDPNRVG